MDIATAATIITAVALMITALISARGAGPKSVSDLTSTWDKLITHLNAELTKSNMEVLERDKVIIEMVGGMLILERQLKACDIKPDYLIPPEYLRRWGNGHLKSKE